MSAMNVWPDILGLEVTQKKSTLKYENSSHGHYSIPATNIA